MFRCEVVAETQIKNLIPTNVQLSQKTQLYIVVCPCQQSLGIPLLLWFMDLVFTIFDIWPFKFLHAFSSSFTLH